MSKMKSIYDLLQPKLKSELQASARKYDTAKRLKYKLMSSTLWHELTLSDISALLSYSGLYTSDVTAKDIMYGGRILIED
jgi:predicted xylose isomerase-like sugar epimerase